MSYFDPSRYYQGVVSRYENVILKREPENRYDRNAIQVKNISDVQVGFGLHLISYVDVLVLSYVLLCMLLLYYPGGPHPS